MTVTAAAGTPEIVGGEFGGRRPSRGLVLILNGPTERLSLPSVTLIVMSSLSPTSASPGVPLSVPVSGSKRRPLRLVLDRELDEIAVGVGLPPA